MRVLVCGARDWDNKKKIREALKKENWPPGRVELVIGGQKKPVIAKPFAGSLTKTIGADYQARQVAMELGIPVMEFPAEWEFYGIKAGPLRNFWMLKYGEPDLVLAFHKDLGKSKGTKNMVERAIKESIPVRVIK